MVIILRWRVIVLIFSVFTANARHSTSRQQHEKQQQQQQQQSNSYVAAWAEELPARCRESAATCRWLRHQSPIDVGCEFSIRLGLNPEGESTGLGPAILLKIGSEKLWLTPENAEEFGAKRFTARAALCGAVDSGREGKLRGVAMLQIVNSPKYLFHEWATVVQKVLYAERLGIRSYIWIGELSKQLATTFDSPHCPRPDFDRSWNKEGTKNTTATATTMMMQKKKQSSGRRRLGRHSVYFGDATALNSNHHCKIVASYALLSDPKIEAVVYVDSDIVASRETVVQADSTALDKYHRETANDIELTPSGETVFWKSTGSRFYVRDRESARTFLSNWMLCRCGFKDQLSLWHSTVLHAQNSGCTFAAGYNDEIIAKHSYGVYRKYKSVLQAWKEDLQGINKRPYSNVLGVLPSLEATCAQLKTDCPNPEARVCSSETEYPLPELIHYTVDVKHPLRSFQYHDKNGKPRVINIMDVRDYLAMWNFTDDRRTVLEDPTAAPVSNKKFLHDLGLDLFVDQV